MTFFYLSFATDVGFLGATVVRADNAEGAVLEASMRGLNPGGEIALIEIPEEASDEPDLQRLLNRLVGEQELRASGGYVKTKDLPPSARDVFDAHTEFVCEAHNPRRKS